MHFNYDIIVIGAGHAGCEAAMAAANLGSKVLLISMDLNGFAKMSCNPSIGGIAKGQIVREIDALGGYTGLVTDHTTLQFRMLNRSKGPAMWSPRAQCDKLSFSLYWRYLIDNHPNIDVYCDIVTNILFSSNRVSGILVKTGLTFKSKAVVLTAGTFLSGKLFIGEHSFEGGRIGEFSSYGITETLREKGLRTGRMKTGTPPRIDIRSIDLSKSIIQRGDDNPGRFSYLPIKSSIQSSNNQKVCYIFHTNIKVHDALRKGFDRSPLFTGLIKGSGPRYCPSIEDKLHSFSDKDSHQLFLEPEGFSINEYYLQGFSSSLPIEVQIEALQQIDGFENVHILKPAYAVEYDYFDPTQLSRSLEVKLLENLFLAGQINGTTGYEEAAGQGLIAGINAHRKIEGKEPFILRRSDSYIGVLIDDLVTKGVDEPYRMFTSRAEYRILLRQDNADFRLTPKSYEIGLATEQRYRLTQEKYNKVEKVKEIASNLKVKPSDINDYLMSIGSAVLKEPKSVYELVSRPGVHLKNVLETVSRGKFLVNSNVNRLDISETLLLVEHNDEVIELTDIALKYKGYIEREKSIADKIKKLEKIIIPDNINFSTITALSIECRQKLQKYKPHTIGEASRISGISPSDISVILVYLGR